MNVEQERRILALTDRFLTTLSEFLLYIFLIYVLLIELLLYKPEMTLPSRVLWLSPQFSAAHF